MDFQYADIAAEINIDGFAEDGDIGVLIHIEHTIFDSKVTFRLYQIVM